MKIVILVVMILLSHQAFCAFFAEASGDPLDEELNSLLHLANGVVVSPDVRHRFVAAKKQEALNVLARAYNNPRITDRARAVYFRAWNWLQANNLNYPDPTQEYPFCAENPNRVYAFAEYGRIYLCSRWLRNDESYLVESIIHEVGHVTGLDGQLHSDVECGATMLQFSAMAHAGMGARGSGYSRRCNLYPGYTIR